MPSEIGCSGSRLAIWAGFGGGGQTGLGGLRADFETDFSGALEVGQGPGTGALEHGVIAGQTPEQVATAAEGAEVGLAEDAGFFAAVFFGGHFLFVLVVLILFFFGKEIVKEGSVLITILSPDILTMFSGWFLRFV